MKTLAKLHLHVTNQCTHYCKHYTSDAGRNGKRLGNTRRKGKIRNFTVKYFH